MARPKTVKLKSLEDLIHVLSVAQIPLLHHVKVNSKHVYFVPIGVLGGVEIVYYVESNYPLSGRFVYYNTYTGDVTVSDYVTSDTRVMVVPIVEVEKHNLFQEKIFYEGDRKERESGKNGQSAFAVVLGRSGKSK